MSFCTGRVRKHGSLFRFPLESRLDVPIWSRTDRTRLSLETNTSTTRAIFHSLRAAFSSHRKTTSFTQMFWRSFAHFFRLLIESRYSCLQRVQKMFTKYCTRRQRFWRYRSCRTKLPEVTSRLETFESKGGLAREAHTTNPKDLYAKVGDSLW